MIHWKKQGALATASCFRAAIGQGTHANLGLRAGSVLGWLFRLCLAGAEYIKIYLKIYRKL
ncbi:hypothetical protein MSKU9_3231 [Komagataeibacter diospyri]|uniref:Uncharacterized protein n=1 Tax=Komagataeibacter diospyri TaxID=1932662 RepID=A0A4P5NTJ7_9PROT|nr:hypothetical protein MSKU9_3231 [Komagataeibacter diospyri]